MKKKVIEPPLKNAILNRVSGNLKTYDELISKLNVADAEAEKAEAAFKQNIITLQESIASLETQFQALKGKSPETSAGGQKIPGEILNTAVDLLLNFTVLRNAGIIKKAVVPMITKGIMNSRIVKEKGRLGLFQNLRSKLSRFF
jgi:hypothetical protein